MRLFFIIALAVGLTACATHRPPVPPSSMPGEEKRVDGGVPVTEAVPQPVPERQARPVTPPQRVTRTQPSNVTLSLLAQAERAMGSGAYDSAMLWLERAQRSAPGAGEVYLSMARLRALQERWSEAEQLCLKALSLAGEDESFRQTAKDLLAKVRRRQV